MNKKRFLEIDLMKILSCFAVIAIHISAIGISDPTSVGTTYSVSLFINVISKFAVPSFIFLSGLALMLRYGNTKLLFFDFIRKRMNSILIPYLGWSFTYFFMYALAGYYAITKANLLSVVFLGTGEFHLYFVVILFQLYLLFPFLKIVIERLDPMISMLLAVSIHLAFAYLVRPFPNMDRIFIPYLIYFIAGMSWGRHYGPMQSWLQKHGRLVGLIYLTLSALYGGSRFFPESPLSHLPQLWEAFSLASILILMTISTALTSSIKSPERISAMITLSAATFYVYLAHPLLIAGFYKFSNHFGYKNMTVLLPLSYLSVTGISFIGALVYLKCKKLLKTTNPRKA